MPPEDKTMEMEKGINGHHPTPHYPQGPTTENNIKSSFSQLHGFS
jgi:hypothetical protein